MIFQNLSVGRIITVYVAQGLVSVFFLFLAYRILKRDKKRLNVIFAGFYLGPAIGILINMIYAPLTDETIVLVMNFLTNYGTFYAPIFLLVFELILLKSEKIITPIKQNIIFIAYAVLMAGLFVLLLIPVDGVYGVTINAGNNWTPEWSLAFFLYLVIIESLVIFYTGYLAFQIYSKFEDEVLKKKWRFFIYGFFALAIFLYGICISNYLANATFRLVFGVFAIVLAIIGGFMMYKGVGQQLEK